MAVKLVKSAARIFEILELFDRERRPMQAAEIADHLGYPLASTHELLKTLVELDYFRYGVPKWAYEPSHKIAKVVDWTKDFVGHDERIAKLMEELNAATQETINLSRRIQGSVKIIKGLESRHAVGVSAKPGTIMPVTQSLTGIVSLSHFNEEDLNDCLARIGEQDPDQYAQLNRALIDKVITEVRTHGLTVQCDVMIDGVGALCCPIRTPNGSEPLVVGIVGPSNRILEHEAHHRQCLSELLSKHRIERFFDR